MGFKAILIVLTALSVCLAPCALDGQVPLLPGPLISPNATADESMLVVTGGLGVADHRYHASFEQNHRQALAVEQSAAVNGGLIGALAGGLAGIVIGSRIDQAVGGGGDWGDSPMTLTLGIGGALIGVAVGHVAANPIDRRHVGEIIHTPVRIP